MLKSKISKKYLLLLIFLLACLATYSCSLSGPENKAEFALYQLDNESILWNDFKKITNKDDYKIKEWITPGMIENYDYTSHIITLNAEGAKKIKHPIAGVYVAVVNGKRMYYGCKTFAADTDQAYCCSFYPGNDLLWLFSRNMFFHKDVRNNDEIKNALISSGKYQAGVSATLDNLSVEDVHDTTYFNYSFTIKNEDFRNVYIIDPDDVTMNSYTTEGGNTEVFIYKRDGTYNNIYTYQLIPDDIPGNPHKIITEEGLSPSNLLYLKSGESIKRSYRSPLWPSYRKLPYGNYLAIFRLVNVHGASAAQRNIEGGTVLNGYVYSNIFDITYSKEKGIVINNRNVVLE